MTVKLNQQAYEHTKRLIEQGKFIDDEREAWSDHHPSMQIENAFIEKKGFLEYSKWFLGVNDEYGEETRRYYEFPYGDFEDVLAAASSPHKAGLPKTNTTISRRQPLSYLLRLISKHEIKSPVKSTEARWPLAGIRFRQPALMQINFLHLRPL